MYGQTTAGVGRPPLVDSDRRLVVASGGGRYAEAAMAGRLFYGANINMVNTSTTLHTTFSGLALANPIGSGKNIIVHEFGYAFVVAAASGAVLALATTINTGNFAQDGTEAQPKCTRDGYAVPVGILDEGATIVAPTIVKIISQHADAATSTYQSGAQVVDLQGSIILVPGRALVTDTTVAAGAASAQFSFMWEEVDV